VGTATGTGLYSDQQGYLITADTAGTATITRKTLTVSGITAADKTYNGTTTATIVSNNVSIIGIINPDVVSLRTNGYTATFADKNVGTAKTITLSGLTLSPGVGTNYSVTTPTNLTAKHANFILSMRMSSKLW
jgi:hypothetical protein